MTISPNHCETLYLPLAQPNRAFAWEVFHGSHRMGAFSSQDECFRHALYLAGCIGRQKNRPVRLKIEDGVEGWTTIEGYVPGGPVCRPMPVSA
ncbi:hypothetical protein [Luteibacter sp. 9135]|uniref:hypothetical protein n=1 Tax=Luteibacter sp. 9135 TaxID=1500893 RepID=UPI00055A2668|nr:hypothetical protein [Luteibacter sp. 9135]